MELSPEALTRLVCPACHASLRLHEQSVVCTSCARTYPIVDGLPILIPARAIPPRS